MILFTILALMVIIAGIIAVVVAGTIGGATLLVFGDVIVCVLILYWIVKLIFKKKG